MSNELRQKRLRTMVSQLNKQRKRQAQKTDILCNDLVAGQREFIRQLGRVSFAAAFYKTMIAPANVDELLASAAALLTETVGDANVAFFVRRDDAVALSIFESDRPIAFSREQLQKSFNGQLVDDIVDANKLYSMDDIFGSALEGEHQWLKRISAFSIPLSHMGRSLGFMLIYRPIERPIRQRQVAAICDVLPALAKAIVAIPAVVAAPVEQPAD